MTAVPEFQLAAYREQMDRVSVWVATLDPAEACYLAAAYAASFGRQVWAPEVDSLPSLQFSTTIHCEVIRQLACHALKGNDDHPGIVGEIRTDAALVNSFNDFLGLVAHLIATAVEK